MAQTVPHEVAHLLCYLRHGNEVKPHGEQWQSIMKQLNAEPRRTHCYSMHRQHVPEDCPYRYHCDCPRVVHTLMEAQHHQLKQGRVRVRCQGCNTPLKPLAA